MLQLGTSFASTTQFVPGLVGAATGTGAVVDPDTPAEETEETEETEEAEEAEAAAGTARENPAVTATAAAARATTRRAARRDVMIWRV
jgi:hypothetical protein